MALKKRESVLEISLVLVVESGSQTFSISRFGYAKVATACTRLSTSVFDGPAARTARHRAAPSFSRRSVSSIASCNMARSRALMAAP